MTGLVLLAPHLNAENYAELLAMSRGQSKRAIERLLARAFQSQRYAMASAH